MLLLLITNFALFFLFYGIQSFISIKNPLQNPGKNFLLGFSYTALFLSFLSLLFPISSIFLLFSIPFGIYGCIKSWGSIKIIFLSEYGLTLLFLTATISYLMGYDHYPFNTDTDIYHMNAVQWLKEYGTVKGLANLNNRLGFNSTWHMIAAYLDHGILKGRSPWILPCLSYICSFSYFLFEILNEKKLWKSLYSLGVLFWTLINVLTWGFPSLHYDFIPLLINSIVFYEVLKYIDNHKWPTLKDQAIWMILLSFSFTLKQLGAISILFLFTFCIYSLHRSKKLSLTNIIIVSALPLLILTLWVIRNILLSGYPFYPSTTAYLDLEWRYPKEQLIYLFKEILGWARGPGENYFIHGEDTKFNWIHTWLTMQKTSIRFNLLATIPMLLALCLWVTNLLTSKRTFRYFILSWPLSCLIFWFLTAPDIRFGDGFFFCLLGSAFSFNPYIQKFVEFSSITRRRAVLLIPILTSFACILLVFTHKRGPVNFLTFGKHGPAPMRKILLPTGLEVWEGIAPRICNKSSDLFLCPDNMNIYKDAPACGHSPLPCTPWVEVLITNKVGLIGKTLKEGFKSNLKE